MSGWGDAGELALEGINVGVDKYYDTADDTVRANYRWAGDKVRRWSNKAPRYDKTGRKPAGDQPPLPEEEHQQQQLPTASSQPQYSGHTPFYEPDQAAAPERKSARPDSRPRDMSDNGYGQQSDYGRHGSRYDDGYGADEYRERYKPTRPAGPYDQSSYDPSRYAPAAAAGGAVGAAGAYPPRDQRYLPPPTPRAYDDPYDDGYDSYEDERDRRVARRRRSVSKSRSGYGSRSRRGSSGSRDRDGSRDRGHDDDKPHKPPHQMAVTVGGAAIGGLIGHEISSRRGKPETFTSIAGAVIGAVAAREANKWWDHHQEDKKEKERAEHEAHSHSRRDSDDGRYQF